MVFMLDAGYANTLYFIAPYRNVRCHLQEQSRSNQRPSNAKELFNLRHAQLRNHVKCIIGVLKMCFPILKCVSYYPIDAQRDIMLASCVLHNFIKKNYGSDQWLSQNSNQINPGEIVDITDGDEHYPDDVLSLNDRRCAGNSRSNQISQAM
jgi:hypothetical protein